MNAEKPVLSTQVFVQIDEMGDGLDSEANFQIVAGVVSLAELCSGGHSNDLQLRGRLPSDLEVRMAQIADRGRGRGPKLRRRLEVELVVGDGRGTRRRSLNIGLLGVAECGNHRDDHGDGKTRRRSGPHAGYPLGLVWH